MYLLDKKVELVVGGMKRGFEFDMLGEGKYIINVKEYGNESWEEIEEGDMFEEYEIVKDVGVVLKDDGIKEGFDIGIERDENNVEYDDFSILDMWIDNLMEGGYEMNIYKVI